VREALLIAAFGAAGALCRWRVSLWCANALHWSFPIGTLTVNVAGCFLLGLAIHVGTHTSFIPVPVRSGVAVGLLGALTTFSTFGYETVKLLEAGAWHLAIGNVAANVAIGLIAVSLGLALARALVPAAVS